MAGVALLIDGAPCHLAANLSASSERRLTHLFCTTSQAALWPFRKVHRNHGMTFPSAQAVDSSSRVHEPTRASRKFINSPDAVVTEAIQGLVACTPYLRRLDGFPHIKVVFDTNHPRERVALIAGGGSGHEPLAAGFVGPGLLSAAAAGDIFASPAAESVLAAIRTVTGHAGCLLLVPNYTGDRLNFGLAAEQAKAEGYKVEVLIMGDDCVLPEQGNSKRRGLAGSIFAYKIAGAAAAAGLSLEDVTREASEAMHATCSCGIASAVCTLPGHKPSHRLSEGEVEVGLGIHGEPGVAKQSMQPANDLVQLLVDKLMSPDTGFATVKAGDEATLLVNNMGSTPPSELYLVARSALDYLTTVKQVRIGRAYVGTFCTSLDMAGFSLSLQHLTPSRQKWLDAPAVAPGWPSVPAFCQYDKAAVAVPQGPDRPTAQASHKSDAADGQRTALGQILEKAVHAACQRLIAAADDLDDLDEKAGDGDCGTTLRRGAEAALREAEAGSIPWNNAARAATAVAAAARHMGGTSGALYNIFFTSAAGTIAEESSAGPSPQTWADAMQRGVDAMRKYGGAKAGDRTMLDALLPAALSLTEALQSGESSQQALYRAVQAAKHGGAETASMKALAGRAAYVPSASIAGVADPGALAVGIWLQAIHDALFPA